MRKTFTVAAVVVAILSPASAASAAPATQYGTGEGNAYGNCRHSSAGGQLAALQDDRADNHGNGGFTRVTGSGDCKSVPPPPPVTAS